MSDPKDLYANMRQEYEQSKLLETEATAEPFTLFQRWFDEALGADIREPNAMTLATVDVRGRPAARIVLLKEANSQGFVFYTNIESRKASELQNHPYAALVFWWDAIEKQVRVEGSIEQVSDQEADAYFALRPRKSQLGAWASNQSQPIENRDALEARMREADERFAGQEIPRPPFWSGYRLIPDALEFWQGRRSRLHDRLFYQRNEEGGWTIQRLCP